MTQYLSLILCFLFLFFAGGPQRSGSGDCCGSNEVCCLQESAEQAPREETPDYCHADAAEQETATPDCCGEESAERHNPDSVPDCCRQDEPAEQNSELPDQIPDCCGN